jgi:hypothetical protein
MAVSASMSNGCRRSRPEYVGRADGVDMTPAKLGKQSNDTTSAVRLRRA